MFITCIHTHTHTQIDVVVCGIRSLSFFWGGWFGGGGGGLGAVVVDLRDEGKGGQSLGGIIGRLRQTVGISRGR